MFAPIFRSEKTGSAQEGFSRGPLTRPIFEKKPYFVKNQRLIRADYCKITYDFQNQSRYSNLYFEYYEFGTTSS